LATNLFKNVPVRRQIYSTVKKKKEELKKIEDLLMAYGLIKPSARLTLQNNKDMVWQKTAVSDLRSALLTVLTRNVSTKLEKVTECLEDNKV